MVHPVETLQYEQGQILLDILKLHVGATKYHADVTYGSGSFYRNHPAMEPLLKFDLDPQKSGVVASDSRHLPLADQTLYSAVFDPPFLTYVRSGREGNGKMVMANRFAGFWTYGELTSYYNDTLVELHRVVSRLGIVVMKCQDIVHNHRLHPTHIIAIQQAQEAGFRLKDMFVLGAKHRMPGPNRSGIQRHARIHHSYFLVLERGMK